MNFSQIMHDYPWLFGIIMIVGGPICAFFGRRFFPWVISGIVAVTLLLGTLIVCSVLGFMETTIGLGVSIGVAAILAVISVWLVFKTVWIAVGILGLIGGFFLGSLIYSMFLVAIGGGALWMMISFSFLCSIFSGWLSFKYSKPVVLFFTSTVGSYAFMRGCSYFFGGYPSEAVIFHSL